MATELMDIEAALELADRSRLKDLAMRLKLLKEQSLVADDEIAANYIWVLETVVQIQSSYFELYDKLKNGEFPKGWDCIVTLDGAFSALERHIGSVEGWFGLPFIRKHYRQFESLFPYKLFLSPEMVTKLACSICEKPLSLRNSCGHIIGNLYRGELCREKVIDMKVLSIWLVTSPAQKYSVAHFEAAEYDYSMPAYVIERLQSPLDVWDTEWSQ